MNFKSFIKSLFSERMVETSGDAKKVLRYNPNDFWDKPVYLPSYKGRLTTSKIETVESQIGFKLPSKLIELLTIQNGGYVNTTGYAILEEVYGIGEGFPNIGEETARLRSEFDDPKVEYLVPLNGDGHEFICLDYRFDTENPKVTRVDLECNEEEVLGESFESYIENDLLTTQELHDLQPIYTSTISIEELEQILKRYPQFIIMDMGYNLNGYNQFRIDSQSFKILGFAYDLYVRKGFIRPSEEKYETMKDLMPETVSQLRTAPQHHKTILKFSTHETADLILSALKEENVEVTIHDFTNR
ncbi:SUKH superfamily protein [Neolewinella xylanilytica]|uniref:SUKH superfamily protein n=1 Tax=Neolewinella xylanilytica TaxID=1514080 RepID=A0A2S6HZP8_9BACT|nr:SMI1/KNR4 family protein [Neolewinella xylanilytica]PPK83810.1 SUKH superfamily protein [Neolewinella xylanilytica]